MSVVQDALLAEDAAAVEEAYKVSTMRRQRDQAVTRVRNLETERAELLKILDFQTLLDQANPEPPKWLSPAKPKTSHGTLMLLLSDLHLDEVVKPEEMDFLNAYDRDIAVMRMEKWAQNVVKLSRHYMSGIAYDGVVLMLGGDTFSGNIHDELRESNADLLFGSLLFWIEQIAAAIDMLADEFGKVHVVAVPGNHGRMTRKPRAKGRSRDNLDWLLAKLLSRDFKTDKRVTFDVPDAFDAHFKVYEFGQLLTHGDQASGGQGIGGIWPPVMKLKAKKQSLHMATGKPFDVMWIGHFHQYISGPGLIVNGALKGYDEYARSCSFGFEVPQQAMAIITPEHNITWQCPVFCMDRTKEGW